MRLRNVKGAREALESHPKVLENVEEYQGNWHALFNNNQPIHIEIGMGKGQFISTLASQNPNINYIGFEKYSSVLFKALEKVDTVETNNLFVIRTDAENIDEIFHKSEVGRIYLNFSDPWPKERHAKRRLTHQNFLTKYATILDQDGEVHFKTDNKTLFDFSVEQFKENEWIIKNLTYDLHKSPLVKENIMTEYEEKFVALGHPIYKLEAYYR